MRGNRRIPQIMGIAAAAAFLQAKRDPVDEAVRRTRSTNTPAPATPPAAEERPGELSTTCENGLVVVRIPETTNVLGFTPDQAFEFARTLIANARAGGLADSSILGLPTTQEPKYDVTADGKIVNRTTGVVIPDDEPVFILRGKDRHAVDALRAYRDMCSDDAHSNAVGARVESFKAFRRQHEDRMQEPNTGATRLEI